MRQGRLLLGHAALALLLATAAGACSDGASASAGLQADLRASGAQYVPGALTTEATAGGPAVNDIRSNNTVVTPGATDRTLGGSASNGATAVLIGLDGDAGHWVVPTGAENIDMAGSYVFSTRLSFSPTIAIGTRMLILRAVTDDGTVGPAQTLPLTVQSPLPAGALVVQLEWDVDADMDLKLRMPNASMPGAFDDVWAKAPLALPPQSSSDPPRTSEEISMAGKLDFDSNSQCRIDGRRHENIVFPQAPPSGSYQVRVDTFSLCGQVAVRWHAVAVAGDQTLGEARGQMGDIDTRGAHTASTGLLAFGFTIP